MLFAPGVALAGVSILTGFFIVQNGQVSLASGVLDQGSFGDLVTIAGAFVFSLQILLIDTMGKRYDSEAFTPSMFATTATLAAITFAVLYGIAPEQESNSMPVATWSGLATRPAFLALITFLCLFPSLLAFVWMNKYQPALSAGQAAVVYTLEPVFASLWAMVLPVQLGALCTVAYANEAFEDSLMIGGAFVLFANVLALWPTRRTESVPATVG